MKRFQRPRWTILAVAFLLIGAGTALAQYTAQRVPCGILVTNWDCGPCAPANQALDAYIPGQGNDVAIIRVHGWWPGADDPIYNANEADAEFLIWNTPGGADYAPHLWLDNYVDVGSVADNMPPAFEARKLVPSPLVVDIQYDIPGERVLVVVDIVNAMPAANYRLFVVLTEDRIFASGTNGEDYHNQAMRQIFPDTDGVPVINTLGQQEFEVVAPVNGRWVFDDVRATVYVQNMDTGEIQNAATMFVSEGDVTAAPSEVAAVAVPTLDAYPNPFNPMTRVRFKLPRSGQATVRVHDLTGRVVRTLVDGSREAGRHEVIWQGRNEEGQPVASGLYLVQLRSADGVSSQKVVLAK